MTKEVLVLGGGLSGLASALLAASRGRKVTLFEAETCGGKSARIHLQGQRIDTGPAVWSFPGVWDRLFQTAGLPEWAALPFVQLDSLGVHHGKEPLSLPPVEPREDWDHYEKRASRLTSTIEALLYTPPDLQSAKFRQLGAHLFSELRGQLTARAYLRALQLESDLEEALAVYALNTGASPEEASALHALVPHAMLQDLRVPVGGIHELVLRLKAACVHLGVQILEHTPVTKVKPDRIDTTAGFFSGTVISTLDFERLRVLMGEQVQKPARLSCSGVVLYAVLQEELELPFHSVILPESTRALARDLQNLRQTASPMVFVNHYRPHHIYPENRLPVLSIGLTAAPDGQRFDAGHPWLQEQLHRVESVLQVSIQDKMQDVALLDPFQLSRWGAWGGAIYGRLNSAWRAGPFHVPGHRYRGVWLAGTSVHPGGGIPATLGGALILHQRMK
ncbi:phytoene desaturase family protein [Deinococcus cellulosilyticus]|uniref:Dehydrogenase n=1 Tax=Deinococcus cellulosilyticus (strain DSM 18568 / NBRC 106333 / KACC 11606 / 5516J-15) TaxID=1223518 RepID=A0A511N460_DEIC1|nr:FAD-dependent oxidoreductase [Deinococcus cellulosilyticus]GEM47669.1 dehydrogenase [Deinococcus cellulosilyticus NBRC 106333 = KACC 11606]